jgi:putative glycerol-1-phosphate prenyltransferase
MILNSLIEKAKAFRKSIAVLIDPDKIKLDKSFDKLIELGNSLEIDFFLIGGSLLVSNELSAVIDRIKQKSSIPAVLFPGSNLHIDDQADAILFLSLISGRNPDLLIGQHVAVAPLLKQSSLEILSTGYILVGDSAKTTVAYISQTLPIPLLKKEIAACTAMAGEMLGMKLIYLDAGSGADAAVPKQMISEVKKSINIPLIIGGGINTIKKAEAAFLAGADVLVIGTAIERDINFVVEAVGVRNQFND